MSVQRLLISSRVLLGLLTLSLSWQAIALAGTNTPATNLAGPRRLTPDIAKSCVDLYFCRLLTGLTSDSRGHLWYATDQLGIVEFDGTQRWLYTLPKNPNVPAKFTPSYNGLTIDRQNRVWVWIETYQPDKNLNPVGQERVYVIRDRRLQMAYDQAEIHRRMNLVPPPYFDPDLKNSLKFQQQRQSATIYALSEDQRQDYPFYRLGGILFDRQNRPHFFPGDSLQILLDQQGREWRSEIAITTPPLNEVPLHVVQNNSIMKQFPQFGGVVPLMTDSRNHVWFASYKPGCRIGHISPWYTVFCQDPGQMLPQNTLPYQGSVAEDPQGNIWIGTENGLIRFDGHKWVQIPSVQGYSSIELDRQGRIVALISRESKKVTELAIVKPRPPYPAVYYPVPAQYNDAQYLHVDRFNRIWIACRYGEIFLYQDGKGLKKAFDF
jgi:hypothetical protein